MIKKIKILQLEIFSKKGKERGINVDTIKI